MVLRSTLLLALLMNAGGFAFFLAIALTTPYNPGPLAIFAVFATWAAFAGGGFALVGTGWWMDHRSPAGRPTARPRHLGVALVLSIAMMVTAFSIFLALVTIPTQPACVGGGGVVGGPGGGGAASGGPSCGGGNAWKPTGFVAAMGAEVLSLVLLAVVVRSLWEGSPPGLSIRRFQVGRGSGAGSELHERS